MESLKNNKNVATSDLSVSTSSLTESERIHKYGTSAMLHEEEGKVYITDQSGNGRHILIKENK